jgi:hypothetical protein
MHNLKIVQERVADIEKVELLGVVVEEQRGRIDSIIQGKTELRKLHLAILNQSSLHR